MDIISVYMNHIRWQKATTIQPRCVLAYVYHAYTENCHNYLGTKPERGSHTRTDPRSSENVTALTTLRVWYMESTFLIYDSLINLRQASGSFKGSLPQKFNCQLTFLWGIVWLIRWLIFEWNESLFSDYLRHNSTAPLTNDTL